MSKNYTLLNIYISFQQKCSLIEEIVIESNYQTIIELTDLQSVYWRKLYPRILLSQKTVCWKEKLKKR